MNSEPGNDSGERARIARIARLAPTAGGRLLRATGDDASVVRSEAGCTVTSIDAVVDGVHFERALFAPAEIGYKAAAGAISDLAAMGAEAGEVYVAMGVPTGVSEAEFDALSDGVLEAATDSDALLAGGDLTASPVLWIAVTAVGRASDDTQLVYRTGARAGDILVVTGEVGGAGAALPVMRGEAAGLAADVVAALRLRQSRPQPRLAAGRALAAAGATAMIDLSDGIAKDAQEIADAAEVCLEVRLADLPLQQGVADVAAQTGLDPWSLAAGAGEDYELLAALPPDALARLGGVAADMPVTVVGEVCEGAGACLRDADGKQRSIAGYEHFAV